MECSWKLRRYSRCYTDYNKQARDSTGQISLFPFFVNSKHASLTVQSQLINTGVWSTIMHSDKTEIYLSLKLITESSCSLQVRFIPQFDEWELQAAGQMISESNIQGPILLVL